MFGRRIVTTVIEYANGFFRQVKHEFCRATVAGTGEADSKYIKDESTTGVFHTANWGFDGSSIPERLAVFSAI